MARPTPAWLLLSSSHYHILPHSPFFLRTLPPPPPPPPPPHLLRSRLAILHASNVNFNPWKFGGEDDDEDADTQFPRQRMRRRRRRRRKESLERRWWSDDVRDNAEVSSGGILEQLLDDLWIFKVFRAYGLFLPVILLSLLLATGPKAFLMGSGVPFGLSLLVFAFNKLSEWLNFSPSPKPKRRPRRSSFSRRGDISTEGKDRQAREPAQAKRSKRSSYERRVNGFGGWDELVAENEPEITEKPLSMKEKLEMMIEKKVEKKVDSSSEKRELPLLLRLLVGFFPFLGSWTELL